MLNLMSIQIEIHRTANLRRNPPPKNMNQTNSASQFRKATQIQNPQIIRITADILRRSFHSNIHPHTPLGLGSSSAGTPLTDDGAAIHETHGAVVEIERTEVGIIDGEFGD